MDEKREIGQIVVAVHDVCEVALHLPFFWGARELAERVELEAAQERQKRLSAASFTNRAALLAASSGTKLPSPSTPPARPSKTCWVRVGLPLRRC